MKIAICDDEEIFVDNISKYLLSLAAKNGAKCEFIKCNRGHELIEICKREKVDVVFLDISMPGFNGFETAEQLQKIRKNLILIFVSSKESLVFTSYEYMPFWFVPKSQMELLEIVMNKIVKKLNVMQKDDIIVPVKIGSEIVEIDVQTAVYFKNEEHYVNIFTKENEPSNSYRCTLNNIENQIGSYGFVRSHNRYLVNLRFIREIANMCIITHNYVKIPVSRSKINEVKEIFQNYLRSIR